MCIVYLMWCVENVFIFVSINNIIVQMCSNVECIMLKCVLIWRWFYPIGVNSVHFGILWKNVLPLILFLLLEPLELCYFFWVTDFCQSLFPLMSMSVWWWVHCLIMWLLPSMTCICVSVCYWYPLLDQYNETCLWNSWHFYVLSPTCYCHFLEVFWP